MNETLHVPEEHLLNVIKVIRAGLSDKKVRVPREVRQQLKKWCDEEEKYITQE